MNAMPRTLGLVTGLALAMALGACHKNTPCGENPAGSDCPPTPPPPTLAPAPMVLSNGAAPLEFDALARIPFDSPRTGTLEPEVRWTYATSEMVILVASGACTFDDLFEERCSLISTWVGTADKLRKFSLGGRSAGPYVLFIGNGGPDDESVSFQVVLYPAAGATSASADERTRGRAIDLKRFARRVELP